MSCINDSVRAMEPPHEIIRDYLNRNGYRYTSEREAIIDVMFDNHSHFTVAEIQAELKKRGQPISKVTIYRNVPLLVDCGLIREVDRRGRSEEQVFEQVYGHEHHDHLICIRCGKIVEFMYEAIEILQKEVARQHGFKLVRHILSLRGICPDCKEAESNQAKEDKPDVAFAPLPANRALRQSQRGSALLLR